MRLNYLSVLFPLLTTVDNSQRERNCRRQELPVKEQQRSRQDSQKFIIEVKPKSFRKSLAFATGIFSCLLFDRTHEINFSFWKTWEL